MQRRTLWRQRVRVAVMAVSSVALVVAAGLWVSRGHPIERWLSFLLARGLEAATGERAAVGRVDLQPARLAARVEGLVLVSRRSGEPILAVRAVTARAGLSGLVPGIEEIHVEAPVASLHLDAGGLREFQGVGGGRSGSRRPTPWRHLRVTDGRLDLALPDGRITVDDLDVVPGERIHVGDVSAGRVDLAWGRLSQTARDVRLARVELAFEHLVVPAVDVRFPQLALTGDLTLVSDGRSGGTVEVVADLSALDPALGPGRRAEGEVRAVARVAGEGGTMEVEGTLAGTPLAFWRTRADGGEVAVRFGAFDVRWRLAEGGVVEVPAWEGTWAEGTLAGSARWQPVTGALAFHLETRGVHLEPLLRDLAVSPGPWVDIDVDLVADLAGTIGPFTFAGPFRADTRGFEVHSGPARAPRTDTLLAIPRGRLEGALAFDAGAIGIGIDRLVLTNGSTGQGEVHIGFHRTGPLVVDLHLDPVNLADFAPLGGLELGGRGSLDAHLEGPFSAPAIQGIGAIRDLSVFGIPWADEATLPVELAEIHDLRFSGFEARRGDTRYGGNLAVDFHSPLSVETQILVRDGRIRDLAGLFVDLPGVDGRVQGTLELAGTPYALDGGAEMDLHDVTLLGERFPSGHATARMDGGRFTLPALTLSRAGGRESLLARGTVGPAYAANFEVLSDGL